MARYRNALPQMGADLFLTDGGIETALVFLEGIDLPEFAAFDLLKDAQGQETLRRWFRAHAQIAKRFQAGLLLESVTWRANTDWAAKLGYTSETLAEANRSAIRLLEEIRSEVESETTPIVISGCIGPRGDGYQPGQAMSPQQAEAYHLQQVETFAQTAADMVAALTINEVEEAVGIAQAAKRVQMPLAVSFTVETDGRLPTGATLQEAIECVDDTTAAYPSYYMINCAHPTHFEHVLEDSQAAWTQRIRGLRANASCKSHAELNESTQLDMGNPAQLGAQLAQLKQRLKHLTVLGGCCGTDLRHIEQIAQACSPLFSRSG